jgi:hypothetical protein
MKTYEDEPEKSEHEEMCEEMADTLLAAWSSIDALLRYMPRFEGKLCGCNTLGNLRAEIWSVLNRQKDEPYARTAYAALCALQAHRDEP